MISTRSKRRSSVEVGTSTRLVDEGKLRPQIEVVLPLEQVREALGRVAGRHTRGKVVLRIGQ